MKKTVCLLTDWYPTKKNPYHGLFFKEQAFAVEEQLDFIIVRYHEVIELFPKKKYSVVRINTEKNTVEYDVTVSAPLLMLVWDEFYSLYRKYRKLNLIVGVGKYLSPWRKKFTQNALSKIFCSHFLDQIDVFYCVDAQTESFPLQCAANALNRPYVISEHAPFPWPGMVLNDANKEAIEKADLFLAISQDKIRQLMLQNIHLPKTVYIGNLVDEQVFVLRHKDERKRKTLLIVAAHTFYKNYEMFINVMDRLIEITEVPFSVMIVGYGANNGYSKGVEEFEKEIRNSRFSGRVRLLPEIPHDKMPDIYHEADAFVMTSIQEGQPISAMEAACCGLPIFSTRCGGVEDYVDASMGCIYAINDHNGMAEGLKLFLEGKNIFDSAVIRAKAVEKFGMSSFKKEFISAFEGVIDNAKS